MCGWMCCVPQSVRGSAQHPTRDQLHLSPTTRPSQFSSHRSRARVAIPRPATPTLPPTPRETPLETPPAVEAPPAPSPQPSETGVRTQPQVSRAPSKVHVETPKVVKRTPPEPEDSLLSPGSSPESKTEHDAPAPSARARQPDRQPDCQAGNVSVPTTAAYQTLRGGDSGEGPERDFVVQLGFVSDNACGCVVDACGVPSL